MDSFPQIEYLTRPLTMDEYRSARVASEIFSHRMMFWKWVEEDKSGGRAAVLRAHYANAPWDFAKDWVVCYEPRVRKSKEDEKLRDKFGPFIPFPRHFLEQAAFRVLGIQRIRLARSKKYAAAIHEQPQIDSEYRAQPRHAALPGL